MSLASTLQALLDERHWSAEKLSRRADVTGSHVRRILSGERKSISLVTAQKLADALEVSPSVFFDEPLSASRQATFKDTLMRVAESLPDMIPIRKCNNKDVVTHEYWPSGRAKNHNIEGWMVTDRPEDIYFIDTDLEAEDGSTVACEIDGALVFGIYHEDIKALLDQCDRSFTGLRDKAMILVLLDTGVRMFELVGMRLGDIQLERRAIQVRGKGNKARLVPFSLITQKHLWNYLKQPRKGGDAVWLTEEKTPLKIAGVREIFRRKARFAGLTGPRRSAHTFRHTFAMEFLRARRGSLFDLMRLGGWESLESVKPYTASLSTEDAFGAYQESSPVDRMGLR